MSNAIMFDLETMSTRHDAAIIQIGACVFDQANAEMLSEFLVNVSLADAIDKKFALDEGAINFWMKEANKTWMEGSILDTKEALILFKNWLEKMKIDYAWKHIWCHATFDAPIIFHAFEKFDLKPPFNYRSVLDLRTLTSLAEHKKKNGKPENAHDALIDCKYQIGYCVDALNELNFQAGRP